MEDKFYEQKLERLIPYAEKVADKRVAWMKSVVKKASMTLCVCKTARKATNGSGDLWIEIRSEGRDIYGRKLPPFLARQRHSEKEHMIAVRNCVWNATFHEEMDLLAYGKGIRKQTWLYTDKHNKLDRNK